MSKEEGRLSPSERLEEEEEEGERREERTEVSGD
jgi:hypothetical protein